MREEGRGKMYDVRKNRADQNSVKYIKWMLGEGGGAMSQEEVAVAEAPEDADAR